MDAVNTRMKPHCRVLVPWMLQGGRRALFTAFGLHKTERPNERRVSAEPTGERNMKPDDKPTIEAAHAKLREAQERYNNAHNAYEAARSRETDARNELNRAQRAFDNAVAAVKKNAPWNSDWHQAANRQVAAER